MLSVQLGQTFGNILIKIHWGYLNNFFYSRWDIQNAGVKQQIVGPPISRREKVNLFFSKLSIYIDFDDKNVSNKNVNHYKLILIMKSQMKYWAYSVEKINKYMNK